VLAFQSTVFWVDCYPSLRFLCIIHGSRNVAFGFNGLFKAFKKVQVLRSENVSIVDPWSRTGISQMNEVLGQRLSRL